MKIIIRINKPHLDSLIEGLTWDRDPMPQDKIDEKVVFYLFNDVLKKLLKKQVDKSDSTDKKWFNIVLTYPHAAALYNELRRVVTVNIYVGNACLKIRNNIYKEL